MIFLLLTVFPGSYIYRDGINPIMSVNGSSEDGNCYLKLTLCNEPTTSVLQDGIIPTLDGNMWASQLLTMNPTKSNINITFDFKDTQDYAELQRVEVVMFNCP